MRKWVFGRVHQSSVVMGFLIGIVVGIIGAAVFRMSFFSSWYWVIFSTLLLLFGIWRANYLMVVVAVLAGGVLGGFRVGSEVRGQKVLSQLVGKIIVVSGRVKGDPDFEENSGKIKLNSLEIDGKSVPGTVYLSGRLEDIIQRDDRLTIRGKMSNGFGVYFGSFYSPEILQLSRPKPGSFLIRARNKLAETIKDVTRDKEREANLGISYLLGLRNGLDKELTEMLSLVGLTHLVVASGTHLGILVEFFRKVFGKLSRFSGVYFSILFIMLFGGMIGWTASITRAAIVAILGILGWYLGRSIPAWRLILVAMALTLMVSPMNFLDLGWLLSFGSFIGIMILGPSLKSFFYDRPGGKLVKHGKKTVYIFPKGYKRIEKPGAVAEIILATVSATMMCAPILLYYFGTISLISLVANLLILPTIPFAMGLTFLVGVLGIGVEIFGGFWFLTVVEKIVVKITTILLSYHIGVMSFFSEQKSFLVEIPKGDARVLLLYIPILIPFLIVGLVNLKNQRKQERLFHEEPEKYLRFSVD